MWRSGFATKASASQAIRDFLGRVDAGKDPFPDDITFRDWVARWLDSERVRSLRPHTAARYQQVLEDYLLPDLGALKLADIRPRHIRPVLDSMAVRGRAPRSLNEAKNILSTVFRAALEDEVVETNPVSAVRAKAYRRRPLNTPTTDDMAKLIETAGGTVWEMPLVLAAYLGMRRGEILALQWSDIDLDSRTFARSARPATNSREGQHVSSRVRRRQDREQPSLARARDRTRNTTEAAHQGPSGAATEARPARGWTSILCAIEAMAVRSTLTR